MGDLFGGGHAAESWQFVAGVRGVRIDADHADVVLVDEHGGRAGDRKGLGQRHDPRFDGRRR